MSRRNVNKASTPKNQISALKTKARRRSVFTASLSPIGDSTFSEEPKRGRYGLLQDRREKLKSTPSSSSEERRTAWSDEMVAGGRRTPSFPLTRSKKFRRVKIRETPIENREKSSEQPDVDWTTKSCAGDSGRRSLEVTREAATSNESIRPILEDPLYPRSRGPPAKIGGGSFDERFFEDKYDRVPVLRPPSIDRDNAVDDEFLENESDDCPEFRCQRPLKTYPAPGPRKWISPKRKRTGPPSPIDWGWYRNLEAEDLWDEFMADDAKKCNSKNRTIRDRQLMMEIRKENENNEEEKPKKKPKRTKKKNATGSPPHRMVTIHYKGFLTENPVVTYSYDSDDSDAGPANRRQKNRPQDETDFFRSSGNKKSTSDSDISNCSATTENRISESIFEHDQRKDTAKDRNVLHSEKETQPKKKYKRIKPLSESSTSVSSAKIFSGHKNVTRRKPVNRFSGTRRSNVASLNSQPPKISSVARKRFVESSSEDEVTMAKEKSKSSSFSKIYSGHKNVTRRKPVHPFSELRRSDVAVLNSEPVKFSSIGKKRFVETSSEDEVPMAKEKSKSSSLTEIYSGHKNVTRRKPYKRISRPRRSDVASLNSEQQKFPSIGKKRFVESSSEDEVPRNENEVCPPKKAKKKRRPKNNLCMDFSDSLLEDLLAIDETDQDISEDGSTSTAKWGHRESPFTRNQPLLDKNANPLTSSTTDNSTLGEIDNNSEATTLHTTSLLVRSNVPFIGPLCDGIRRNKNLLE